MTPTQRRRRQRVAAAAARATGAVAAPVVQQLPKPPTKAAAPAGKLSVIDPARVAELTAQLESEGEARACALAELVGKIEKLAFDEAGCRLVQLALQVCPQQAAAGLLAELRGKILACCDSPHANYVIQKAIEVLPTSLASSIAQELCGKACKIACHRYGCRIVCRLLEHHCVEDANGFVAMLVDEMLKDAGLLCRHDYGRHVVNTLLEHGSKEQRERVIAALRADVAHNATNRNASFLCENVLTVCSADEYLGLANDLLGIVPTLAMSQFGCFVLKALMRLPGDYSQIALNHIKSAAGHLQASKYGSRLLQDLEL